MVRILDRYLVREIAAPLLLGLTVLTFILELPPILQQAEEFIARGVEWRIVVRLLMTLLPQALCLTIPMSVLLGILMGLGRLSADRELVAIQACGVSLMRLARPVLLVASVGAAATAYETVVALPDGNQTYREIVYVLMASRIESTVKPRVFFEDFPDKVIYVRELPPEGGWRDVFLADTSTPQQTTVYFAREGRIRLDRERRLVQLELRDGTSNTTLSDRPDDYEERAFKSLYITLDPDTVFKRPPPRGTREMTSAELREEIRTAEAQGQTAYDARFMLQQKASLPMACPILALIGLALGATNRKEGRLASFAVGVAVSFLYYVLLFGARSMAMGGRFSPELAPWTPNIVLGLAGLILMAWRVRASDRGIRLTRPAWLRLPRRGPRLTAAPQPATRRVVLVIRVPKYDLRLPRVFDIFKPRILDLYLSAEYIRIFVLGLLSLLGLFYVSTFIDLVDKLLRGEATLALLLRYFVYQTPQFLYWIIPMGVLVSTLVTVGLMTKSGELLVMRACGISIYRSALPLLAFGALASGLLFFMQERVMATANREADTLNRIIRRWPPQTTALTRRWLIGSQGDIYHYDGYDQGQHRFVNLLVYRLDEPSWRLRSLMRAGEVTLAPPAAGQEGNLWTARGGWTRELPRNPRGSNKGMVYKPFAEQGLPLESPTYFATEEPIADFMTYAELRDHIARLRASGANVIPQIVALQRKIAFPFVTIILTVLAVPFAVTTGRRGAMYGIGIGIVLAIVYWMMLSVSGALGAGGVLPPFLAAWSPNIIFGAAALYLVLTVRT